MYIPSLAKGISKEEANKHVWTINNSDATIHEYSGDTQITTLKEPYAGTYIYQRRLEELIAKKSSPCIALIQGYQSKLGNAVIGTAIVPYEGIRLPNALEQTITNKIDFLYETFAQEIHQKEQRVVGFVIDNPQKLETSFKIHHAFEEKYLAHGPFYTVEDHQLATHILTTIKNRLNHYKNIFGWN